MTRDRVSAIADGRVRNATFPSANASTPSVADMARAQRAHVFVLWATKERIALRVSVCAHMCDNVALHKRQWLNNTFYGCNSCILFMWLLEKGNTLSYIQTVIFGCFPRFTGRS